MKQSVNFDQACDLIFLGLQNRVDQAVYRTSVLYILDDMSKKFKEPNKAHDQSFPLLCLEHPWA